MSVSCVKCQEQKTPAAGNVTYFDRSFEKVLSRRKRFFVWRPGSNLLVSLKPFLTNPFQNFFALIFSADQLTASLVKPLAFPRPGGHNLILEWDIFYPLPDSWRKPKRPTPPPPPPTTTEVIETWDPHSGGHSGEIWMPDGGWDSDVIKTLSSGDEEPAEKRLWNAPPAPQVKQIKLKSAFVL